MLIEKAHSLEKNVLIGEIKQNVTYIYF